MNEWIFKMWYIYTQMEYYSCLKRNEILVTWMNLQDITLSETNQSQKDKYWDSAYMRYLVKFWLLSERQRVGWQLPGAGQGNEGLVFDRCSYRSGRGRVLWMWWWLYNNVLNTKNGEDAKFCITHILPQFKKFLNIVLVKVQKFLVFIESSWFWMNTFAGPTPRSPHRFNLLPTLSLWPGAPRATSLWLSLRFTVTSQLSPAPSRSSRRLVESAPRDPSSPLWLGLCLSSSEMHSFRAFLLTVRLSQATGTSKGGSGLI